MKNKTRRADSRLEPGVIFFPLSMPDEPKEDSERHEAPLEPLARIKSPILWSAEKGFVQNLKDLHALLNMPRLLYGFTAITDKIHRLTMDHALESLLASRPVDQRCYKWPTSSWLSSRISKRWVKSTQGLLKISIQKFSPIRHKAPFWCLL